MYIGLNSFSLSDQWEKLLNEEFTDQSLLRKQSAIARCMCFTVSVFPMLIVENLFISIFLTALHLTTIVEYIINDSLWWQFWIHMSQFGLWRCNLKCALSENKILPFTNMIALFYEMWPCDKSKIVVGWRIFKLLIKIA